MNRLSFILICLGGLLVIVGCDSDGNALCVPGESKACTGPGACSGYQVCADSADRFGECQCGVIDVIEDVLVDEVEQDAGADTRTADEGQDDVADDGMEPIKEVIEDIPPTCGREGLPTCTEGRECGINIFTTLNAVCQVFDPVEQAHPQCRQALCQKDCGGKGELACGQAYGGMWCDYNESKWLVPQAEDTDDGIVIRCQSCNGLNELCCRTGTLWIKPSKLPDEGIECCCGYTCTQVTEADPPIDSYSVYDRRCVEPPAS